MPALPVVIGAGAIDLELAQAFARLGSTVTVVEASQALLPMEEPEVGALIADVFTRAQPVAGGHAGHRACRGSSRSTSSHQHR